MFILLGVESSVTSDATTTEDASFLFVTLSSVSYIVGVLMIRMFSDLTPTSDVLLITAAVDTFFSEHLVSIGAIDNLPADITVERSTQDDDVIPLIWLSSHKNRIQSAQREIDIADIRQK